MRTSHLFSFLIALVVGCTVFLLALVAGWQNDGGHLNTIRNRMPEQEALMTLTRQLEEVREARGSFPDSLAELPRGNGRIRRNEDRIPVDRWGTPYQYEVKEDAFVLFSCGADRRPGGVGTDADILAGRPWGETVQPTLIQFLVDRSSRPLVLLSTSSGALGFLLTWLTRHSWKSRASAPEPPPTWPAELCSYLIILTAATTVVACFLLAFHVAPGH